MARCIKYINTAHPFIKLDAMKYMGEIDLKGDIVTKYQLGTLTLTCTAVTVFKV
jgi:hypothetical protein